MPRVRTDAILDDEDEEEDTRVRSYRHQVVALRPGESFSKAIKVNVDTVDRDTLQTIKRNLRSTLNKTVSRATIETGHTYSVEGGELFTNKNDILVVVVVTRMDGTEADDL